MTSCHLGNWNKTCEDVVNEQIQIEYWASYQYHLMWSYFDRSDVGLNSIAEYFKKAAEEEREHAHKLMEYQNIRGGTVKLEGIESVSFDYLNSNPDTPNQNNVLLSFQKALDMEQLVYKKLLNVHKVGSEANDPQFTDFIEGEYLEEQVTALNEVAKYISQLQKIGNDGHGIWNFDQNLNNNK